MSPKGHRIPLTRGQVGRLSQAFLDVIEHDAWIEMTGDHPLLKAARKEVKEKGSKAKFRRTPDKSGAHARAVPGHTLGAERSWAGPRLAQRGQAALPQAMIPSSMSYMREADARACTQLALDMAGASSELFALRDALAAAFVALEEAFATGSEEVPLILVQIEYYVATMAMLENALNLMAYYFNAMDCWYAPPVPDYRDTHVGWANPGGEAETCPIEIWVVERSYDGGRTWEALGYYSIEKC